MAVRRMISTQVVCTDRFAALSMSAQLLYFHLNMRGDDDGFVAQAKGVLRTLRIKQACLEELIDAGYLLQFESGVVLIVHWKQHNFLRNDRHKTTLCVAEKALVELDESKCYRLAGGIPNVNRRSTKVREGKVREEKVREGKVREGKDRQEEERKAQVSSAQASEGKESAGKPAAEPQPAAQAAPLPQDAPAARKNEEEIFVPPTVEQVRKYYEHIGHEPGYAQGFVDYYESVGWLMGQVPMRDWKAASRRWAIRENELHSPKSQTAAPMLRNLTSAVNAARNAQYQRHEQTPDPYAMEDIRQLLERSRNAELP